MGEPADIDRLIELGLNRYGAGDLDGALLMWEEALAIDPTNEQANSYVDYVRLNYELLTGGEPAVEEAEYPIEEDPEYIIEVSQSEPARPSQTTLPAAAAVVSLGDIDAGWDVEETVDSSTAFGSSAGESDAPPDIEPDLPEPPPLQLEPEPVIPPREPISFEDATREYHGIAQSLAKPFVPRPGEDFSTTEPTHDFQHEENTGGFGNTTTSVRKRDLGFVQPLQNEQTLERASRYQPQSIDLSDVDSHEDTTDEESDDLIGSLPTPRPADREPESGEILLPSKKSSTRDMPVPSRAPAPASRLDSASLSQAEVMLSGAPTRELTKNELAGRAFEPMLSAPTRELGLRPPTSPGGKPVIHIPEVEEDVPTGQSDARAIREAAARKEKERKATIGDKPHAGEGTRHDIVLPFDPIAAQAAQILDDVDAEAPSGESPDDRTRRRIARLLELAADWSDAGDLDKAVSAVDLALSEDPNSALGQKLITRNKDTIMSLFQTYLGDLDRMPQLAKPLAELANAPISPRAAFLLSRIDGTLTIDELLDVSGMPRLEAYRHLCQLFLRGILR